MPRRQLRRPALIKREVTMYRNKVRMLESGLAISVVAALVLTVNLAGKPSSVAYVLPWAAIPAALGLASLVFRDPDQVDWYGKMLFIPIVAFFVLIFLTAELETWLLFIFLVASIWTLPLCAIGWLAGAIALWFTNRHTRRWARVQA
jgi:hypothetical protein